MLKVKLQCCSECEQRELPVLFANGKLKSPQDKEPQKKPKKWAVPGMAVGNAVFMPDK